MNNYEIIELARSMAEIARKYHLNIETCAEQIDLSDIGIAHGSCIDKDLIEQIIGCKLKVNKDKNQREECRCFERVKLYDVNSPLLCGNIEVEDKITERKMKSMKEIQ